MFLTFKIVILNQFCHRVLHFSPEERHAHGAGGQQGKPRPRLGGEPLFEHEHGEEHGH